MKLQEIDVHILKKKIDDKDDFILIDVRNNSEYYLSRIEGSIHIPMQTIPDKMNEASIILARDESFRGM